MKIAAIIREIERFAPPALQESWDNTGLQVGSPLTECTGVLVCLDVTPAIVEEAISLGCNLIVSHHPLFFKPVKRLTGATLVEATAINAIAAGITIYSTHTAADSTRGGVSYVLAERLGVTPLRPLSPAKGTLAHMRVIAPVDKAEVVRLALFDAGAGAVGQYDCCSFTTRGEGTFRALEGAQPYVGEVGEEHTEDEVAIDVVMPMSLVGKVEKAMLEVHPYETPAYQITAMLNTSADEGLGIYGINDDELTPAQFVDMVKERLGTKAVRTTEFAPDADARIRRVAVCGGAGGEFIADAIAAGAQAYVTADIRYHDFVEYRDRILVIDAGHYETEAPIKDTIAQVVKDRFDGLRVVVTSLDDNPVRYC